ncbi:MAG: hypothetical protein E7184_01840 [Erysipelotrichaceae bacterium]|nr:hypothetical protein [Erysipelotrichaceae bacterium]
MSTKVLRILTGIGLAALVVPLVIIGKLPFDIFIMVLFTGAMYEFLRLKQCNWITKAVSIITVAGITVLTRFHIHNDFSLPYFKILFAILVFSLIFLSLSYFIDDKLNGNDVFLLFTMLLIYTASSYALLTLNAYEGAYRYLLIALLFLPTVVCDTAAYAFGSKFGKTKYIKKISPNKSLEGSIAGYVFGLAMGLIILAIGHKYFTWQLLGAAFVIPVTCQIGDLFFSSIKRLHSAKDFSNLLPGHGGINDRMDSLIIDSIVLLAFILF